MFENLKAEMARKDLTIMDLSKDTELNLSYETLRNKFSGKTEWNKREMFLLKKNYFQDKTIEYLFEQKQPQPDTKKKEGENMEDKNEEVERLTPTDIAPILKMSVEGVRAALRQDKFPFGIAFQGKTGQWNYLIIKSKFEKWLKNV